MKKLLLAFALISFSHYLWAQSQDCIDLSNLRSENIRCTIGRFNDPYLYDSIVDFPTNPEYRRHCVITQAEYDPLTGNELRTIPEGESYSVRLGNWNIGGEAESITCTLDIDTSNYDLLVLRYAAVMEDRYGAHSSSVRPKFTMDILDENDEPINPECTSALFVADTLLGWNGFNTVQHGHPSVIYWKDWTSVGLNLEEYHGRTIKVRLVTYDCDDGGCFGYAYFRLDCRKKELYSSYCGDVEEITVSAPEGFHYRWYLEHEPGVTLSEESTIHINMMQNATLCCYCSFLENADCGFVLKTIMRLRYPMADFSSEETLCLGTVSFFNGSYVSHDGVNPAPGWVPCEGAFWDFGDGTTSTEYEPVHQYASIGDYEVTLVAILNEGQCTDTMRRDIHVATAGLIVDTTTVYSCIHYLWNGEDITTEGWHQQMLTSHQGCDSLSVIYLHLEGESLNEFSVDTCGVYEWNGVSYDAPGDYEQRFDIGQVCDSVVTLHLTLHEAEEISLDTVACDSLVWFGTVIHEQGPHDLPYLNAQGCEGMAHLEVTMKYAPRPMAIEPGLMGGHYVVPATEFQVNEFEYSIADSNAYNVWDSVRWTLSRPDWLVEADRDFSCRVLPIGFTTDTVWLTAKVYGGCDLEPVVRRIWLLCSFYGVDDAEGGMGLELSPNPTTGPLTLRTRPDGGKAIATLYDARGMAARRFALTDAVTTIDLGDLGRGLYILVVESERGRELRKVVKD